MKSKQDMPGEQRRVNANVRHEQGQSTSRLRQYIVAHTRACLYALGELIRAPLASIMTVVVIGIAMAFPAGLYVLIRNVSAIAQSWHTEPTISLYLQNPISQDRLSTLMGLLRQRPEVQSLQYISPEQGLKQFSAQAQFADAIKVLPNNPLPGVIVITAKPQYQTASALQQLLASTKTLAGVDVGRLDVAWIQRLHNLVLLGQRMTYTLGFLFAIGVILIVGNTIRLVVQHHRQEIAVMQLVGATKGFIRLPFLYRGLWYGLFGGLIAWLLVLVLVLSMEAPVAQLIQGQAQTLWTLSANIDVGVAILLLCTLLSLLGSWLVVSHYLNKC